MNKNDSIANLRTKISLFIRISTIFVSTIFFITYNRLYNIKKTQLYLSFYSYFRAAF